MAPPQAPRTPRVLRVVVAADSATAYSSHQPLELLAFLPVGATEPDDQRHHRRGQQEQQRGDRHTQCLLNESWRPILGRQPGWRPLAPSPAWAHGGQRHGRQPQPASAQATGRQRRLADSRSDTAGASGHRAATRRAAPRWRSRPPPRLGKTPGCWAAIAEVVLQEGESTLRDSRPAAGHRSGCRPVDADERADEDAEDRPARPAARLGQGRRRPPVGGASACNSSADTASATASPPSAQSARRSAVPALIGPLRSM